MDSKGIMRELFEQNRECQIDLLVIKELVIKKALALLISRLIASRAVDRGFLDDLIVCAEGLDCGRGAEIRSVRPARSFR